LVLVVLALVVGLLVDIPLQQTAVILSLQLLLLLVVVVLVGRTTMQTLEVLAVAVVEELTNHRNKQVLLVRPTKAMQVPLVYITTEVEEAVVLRRLATC
jgi:hypothetical protein